MQSFPFYKAYHHPLGLTDAVDKDDIVCLYYTQGRSTPNKPQRYYLVSEKMAGFLKEADEALNQKTE